MRGRADRSLGGRAWPGTVAPLIAAGVRLGVVVGLVVGLGSKVEGATACGTLLTNVVTATMSSGFPGFVEYDVSYNATATVMVLCPPVVAFSKLAYWQRSETGLLAGGIPYQEASVGAVVTFSICIDNQTTDSVWGVVLTDQLPYGMAYTYLNGGLLPENDALWNTGNFYSGGAAPVPAESPAVAWQTSVTPAMTPVIAGSPTDGTVAPLYLRWTVPYVGPKHSACVTYTARVL